MESTRMDLPERPYVGLYGSHGGDWREGVKASLTAEGIAFHDPIDGGWAGIDGTNGDARQADIDALVAREHLGMRGAACVIVHLEQRTVIHGRPTGGTTLSLASRCEIGFLAGRGIRTFVHIEPDVEGRNYLWAVVAFYPTSMARCASLDEATALAIAFMKGA